MLPSNGTAQWAVGLFDSDGGVTSSRMSGPAEFVGTYLGQNLANDVGFLDAGELVIEAAVEIGEFGVVEAQKVQNGGVEVADVVAVFDRFVAQLVGLAVGDAAFDAAAGQP